MAARFFLLPIETVDGRRVPKYFAAPRIDDTGRLMSPWSMFDYGLQPIALLASDISGADLTVLQGAGDVQVVPANIDNTIGAGALAATRQALEDLWIPGNWVTASNTWREVLRVVAGLFQFAQRYNGLHHEELMQGAPNLSLTLGDLSAARRQKIQETCDSFGYDTSGFTLSSTLRDVLKFLGDAWGAASFQFGAIATL